MFGISGTGLAVIKTWQNEGKRPRYSVDQWDRVSYGHTTASSILIGLQQSTIKTAER
jgi:hypothetical protein